MGFGRFTKAEKDTNTENLEDSDETEGPTTASLMMFPKIMKRPQSEMEDLKRLYNVEMIRRLSGGLFDVSYLMAKQNERQQQQQVILWF